MHFIINFLFIWGRGIRKKVKRIDEGRRNHSLFFYLYFYLFFRCRCFLMWKCCAICIFIYILGKIIYIFITWLINFPLLFSFLYWFCIYVRMKIASIITLRAMRAERKRNRKWKWTFQPLLRSSFTSASSFLLWKLILLCLFLSFTFLFPLSTGINYLEMVFDFDYLRYNWYCWTCFISFRFIHMIFSLFIWIVITFIIVIYGVSIFTNCGRKDSFRVN